MKLAHGEAFKLMQYQAEDPDTPPDKRGTIGPIEWLWNSRDGVTPFVIGGAGHDDDSAVFMRHINWQDDILALPYVPNVGQRVFVDLTEARARELLRAQVDRQWAWPRDDEYHPADRWPDKGAMFEEMLPDMLAEVERGGPDIVTVTAESQPVFIAQREERRQDHEPPPRRLLHG